MTQRAYRLRQTDPRLGRHVNHDERSKRFPAEAVDVSAWHTVYHAHHGGVLDQGNLGSCTGNAGVDAINIEPNWQSNTENDEALAVHLYSAATAVDPYPGQYPPDDTGSDGLSVCKVMKSWDWISSYTHAFDPVQAIGALMLRPFMFGTVWLEGMFNPDPSGQVHPTGSIAGGHEIAAFGAEVVRTPSGRISSTKSKVWFLNSWGQNWGKSGAFFLSFKDFRYLLAQRGDVSVPIR